MLYFFISQLFCLKQNYLFLQFVFSERIIMPCKGVINYKFCVLLLKALKNIFLFKFIIKSQNVKLLD